MCPRTPDGLRTLRFRHLQLIFKRLRKASYYCKYIAVGEYGTETQRPHYHVLIWTDAPSVYIERLWSDKHGESRGHVHFGSLTVASAMYTLKYVLQPRQRPTDGREFARAQFSRFIGAGYLTQSVMDYHAQDPDRPIYDVWLDGRKVMLPRYYRDKMFTRYAQKAQAYRNYLAALRAKREDLKKFWKQGMSQQEATAKYRELELIRAERLRAKEKHTTHL